MIHLAKAVSVGDPMRQELVLEQRRLAKLWDAFKKQEDEYRAVERERDDLWQRVQELEKATASIGDPTQTLVRLNTLSKENERLRADVGDLGARLEEYRHLFQDEQERLAKLYKVYEDTESHLETKTKEVEKWHRFWEKYGDDVSPKVAQGASKTTGVKLTPKQLAQRKYAGQMRGVRARAADAEGGSGPIKNRTAAKKLRAKYGLKAGK